MSNLLKAMLKIKPLAPLSMVSSIPGSFYHSNHEPTKAMIYGMLENMMGWHYSDEIRKKIKTFLQKKLKERKQDYFTEASGSGYLPLIQNFIRIEKLFLKPVTKSYNDLWTQHLKHNDKRHFDGVRNYDWRISREINNVSSDKEKENLLKKEIDKFPKYYQSPKRREYVLVQGEFIYEVYISEDFKNELLEKIERPISPPFLGTSEGWVDVKIELLC